MRRTPTAFRGVGRRFEVIGEARAVTVIDDYAHHPTEVAATIATARASYPGRRLVVAFQPHLFSRTRDFAAAFGTTLAGADAVWVTDVYAAREAPIPGVTGELIVDAVRRAGHEAVSYQPAVEGVPAALSAALRPGDLCVLMGAGDIDEAAHALLRRLESDA
jgi:UDP-N-acetylmuramate--alanine ligase